jgi:hypothetical protein
MTEVLDVVSTEEQRGSKTSLAGVYGIECLTCITTNLCINGIAFFLRNQYHWSATQTLLLMMIQGMVYALAALLSGRLAKRFSKRKAMFVAQLLLTLLLLPLATTSSVWVTVPSLLAVTMASTLTWPIAESLITEDCDSRTMSRRITVFNLTWSITGVVVVGIYGTILYYWPRGPMVIPVMAQLLSLLLAFRLWRSGDGLESDEQVEEAGHHGVAREDLVRMRRLALWLSRISLPACFVVANALMGLFASLPASVEMGVKLSTVVASLWMAGRVVVFLTLGLTTWWQTRPRLLLGAAVVLMVSFLAIVLPAERFGPFASWPLGGVIAVMAIAELALGLMAGFIYTSSLYFGMVLSEGSTEQGGYHECLIGLGIVVGPGVAAAGQQLAVGNSHWPGIGAVVGIMLLTIAAAGWVTVTMGGKGRQSSSSRKSLASART